MSSLIRENITLTMSQMNANAAKKPIKNGKDAKGRNCYQSKILTLGLYQGEPHCFGLHHKWQKNFKKIVFIY